MSKTLRNVAIAGPTGNIGREILKHLLQNDSLTITALVRKPSDLPARVRTVVVDFTSAKSLSSALRNQDVVIDALNTTDNTSINLIDAASAAGVRRYIPPDFGLDPENTEMVAIPAFYGRAARDRHLAEVCQRTGMTWTIVCNGAFLDWNLRSGFMGIDIYGKKATLLDGGSNPHVWTTLDAAGKATAEILKHPDETENRPVYIHSVVKSEKQMVELAKAALGGDSWEISEQDGKQVFETALADFKAGIYTYQVFGGMIIYANTRADIAHPWPKSDNGLLGVKEMSDAEVGDLIRKLAAERQK